MKLIGRDKPALKLHMLRERDRATMHLRPLMERVDVEQVTEWTARLVQESNDDDPFTAIRAYLAIYGLQTAILEACGMELVDAEVPDADEAASDAGGNRSVNATSIE